MVGLELVAEGIERPEQVGPIVAAGCQDGQGFLFARGVDAKAFTELLRTGTLGPAAGRARVPAPPATRKGTAKTIPNLARET